MGALSNAQHSDSVKCELIKEIARENTAEYISLTRYPVTLMSKQSDVKLLQRDIWEN